MAKGPKRAKNKDNARRSKKKVSILTTEGVDYVDYKDVNLLRRFQSDRAKIRARRVTGNDAQQQRAIAMAIKNAREMALLPYTNRVTQQRGGGRGRGRDDDRGDPRGSRPGSRRRPRRSRRAPRAAQRGARPGGRGRRGPDDRGTGHRGRSDGGGVTVQVLLRSDVDGVGKRGDIVDVARRLRPQLPRAQGLRHPGQRGHPAPGRVDAPVPGPARRPGPRRRRGDRQGPGAHGDHRAGQGRRRGQAVRLHHLGRRGRGGGRPDGPRAWTARDVDASDHIKTTGTHQVPVKLHADVQFAVTIEVVPA